MIQQFHSWAYIWKIQTFQLEKIHPPNSFIAAQFTIAKTWKQPNCPLQTSEDHTRYKVKE